MQICTAQPSLLRYLQTRPEFTGTPIVVEAQARAAANLPPPDPSKGIEVADGFEEAVQAVRRIAASPSFA